MDDCTCLVMAVFSVAHHHQYWSWIVKLFKSALHCLSLHVPSYTVMAFLAMDRLYFGVSHDLGSRSCRFVMC